MPIVKPASPNAVLVVKPTESPVLLTNESTGRPPNLSEFDAVPQNLKPADVSLTPF